MFDLPDGSRLRNSGECYYLQMARSLKNRSVRLVITGIALIPWLLAMYAYYWLDASGTWTADTPHRGKMSVGLLATGMALSFLIYSRLAGRNK